MHADRPRNVEARRTLPSHKFCNEEAFRQAGRVLSSGTWWAALEALCYWIKDKFALYFLSPGHLGACCDNHWD